MASEKKRLFRYAGSIVLYDKVVAHKWEGETYAVSEQKARSNLAYRFKKDAGYASHIPVRLKGKLTLVEPKESA